MAIRPQPYRLKWPLTPSQVEGVDEMFQILFKAVQQVQATSGASTVQAVSTPGVVGSDGEDGQDGLPGIQGIQGIQGPPGAQGTTGMGTPGIDGEDGVDGFPGPTGSQGPTGLTGATGPTGQGVPGSDGDDGYDGFPGPIGPTGPAPSITTEFGIVIDGGGATITTGIKGDVYIPVACTITANTMLADQSGSIVIDVWKDTYANYPPTVADTITASAKPTISSATKSQDTTLTGWTKNLSAGDTVRFNVDSCTTIQRVALALTITVP